MLRSVLPLLCGCCAALGVGSVRARAVLGGWNPAPPHASFVRLRRAPQLSFEADDAHSANGARSGRWAVAALAAAGAAETGAISADKLFGTDLTETLCLAGGACADVLNGPWADFLGIPLSLFGVLAYGSVAIISAAPLILGGGVSSDTLPAETLSSDGGGGGGGRPPSSPRPSSPPRPRQWPPSPFA